MPRSAMPANLPSIGELAARREIGNSTGALTNTKPVSSPDSSSEKGLKNGKKGGLLNAVCALCA
jgi:hypothetical protein